MLPIALIFSNPKLGTTSCLSARDFPFELYHTRYAQRGIPYRRGYLLHGIPGAGKTSVVNALAGVLGLDIYNLSLSGKRMNDQTLIDILSRAPSR